MILNVFIGSIVFLFSWAKVSKDIEEQTQLASITKTVILAILTFVVYVFFIKTYQVTTLYHCINVNDYKYCTDSTGKNIDTIKMIRITNKFSSGLTENREEQKIKKTDDERSTIELGSLYIGQEWNNYNKTYGYNIANIESQGKDTIMGTFFDVPLKKVAHLYEVNVLRTSIPSVIPLLPSFKETNNYSDIENGLKSFGYQGDYHSVNEGNLEKVSHRLYNHDGSINNVEGNNRVFDNAYVSGAFYLDTINVDTTRMVYYTTFSNIANTFNFFTAADVSQYSQAIDIVSNCYVEKMIFMYDLPIEINPYDSCMVTTSHSFSVKGKYLNDNIVKGEGTVFHVKLPTLENLQLIRSLILTTILTALAVLLFSNIFYLIRKYSIKYLELKKEQISEVRLRKFIKHMYILISILLAFLVYIAYKVYCDESFHISMKSYTFLCQYNVYVILGFIILIIALICFLSRNVITKNKK